MIYVFDLDDTLYKEINYVYSGFQAVADNLEREYGWSSETSFQFMKQVMEQKGRGAVFDELLIKHNMYSKKLVRSCLAVYRRHYPVLQLSEDAENCLKRLQSEQAVVYIVTDGHKEVQSMKLKSLGLFSRVRKCYITHRYGISRAKPSPYCLLAIARREQTDPANIVYIGDNPVKDFVGIRPLGFRTIRIRQGAHQHVQLTPEYEAEIDIFSLNELKSIAWLRS
ncbi:HAD family hydrolase [Paenibacillus albus]|uniref:HAD family hydrolase n=1 Tax=Paenibacillus albus TaxID=2495582 RepID=A0A3Q8X1R7_9BACL|nr:HAD family hydrolase [Paenibacillus albus]AZN38497.1 HAD family hydrolase [Paenibacillus albus]